MKIADQLNKMAYDIQQKQMEQAQQQQGQGAQDPKMVATQAKIELDRAKFANDAQIKQAKAQHQMQLQDRKTAQRLMVDRIKVAQKYGSIQP
jgi:D-alanyl-D-alanine dipeptidase